MERKTGKRGYERIDFVKKESLNTALLQLAPVLDEQHVASPDGRTGHFYCCRNSAQIDKFLGPYGEIREEVRRRDCSEKERVLIVSDYQGIVRKTAAFLAAAWEKEEKETEEEDEDEYFDDFFDTEEEDNTDFDAQPWMFEMNFAGRQGSEKEDGNPYHAHVMMSSARNALFFGLRDPADRTKKLESILCCTAQRKFIHVPSAAEKELWVRELVRNEGYTILRLPDMKKYLQDIADTYEKVYQKRKKGDDDLPAGMETLFLPEELESEKSVFLSEKEKERAIRKAEKDCGSWLVEEDILWYLANDKNVRSEEKSALEKLKEMTGLEAAKEAASEMYAVELEQMKNEMFIDYRKHMIFYGNPGTGKTTAAELMSRILAETGHAKEVFVKADRTAIIGRYVGQTAPKVAKLFSEARGGVLFVDEAGFFLNEDAGGYVKEAIREFVRYMEEYEDVTVIFAMYAHEMERFLNLDAGLSSRIGRCVLFEDYKEKELLQIAESMCADRGYTLGSGTKTFIAEYLRKRKKKERAHYGNAREVRKLVESCIICHAVRNMEGKGTGKNVISSADVKDGILRLEKEKQVKRSPFGFVEEAGGAPVEKKRADYQVEMSM